MCIRDRYKNLGFWGSADDHAVFAVVVRKAGKYSVTLDYACPDGEAGDRVRLSAGDDAVSGKIESTGTWDDYVVREFGQLELSAGTVEIVVRSDGEPDGYLMDLRTILLKRN